MYVCMHADLVMYIDTYVYIYIYYKAFDQRVARQQLRDP
jgi:hypothetical protein